MKSTAKSTRRNKRRKDQTIRNWVAAFLCAILLVSSTAAESGGGMLRDVSDQGQEPVADAVTSDALADPPAQTDSPAELSFHVVGDICRTGDFLYRVLEDQTVEIVEYLSEEGITDIPAELAGLPVTVIGDHAFSNEGNINFYTDEYPDYLRESIRIIHVPEGVTRIGARAFYNCFSLVEVTLPESLLVIGEEAFAHCSLLMSIDLPSHLRELGSYAFRGCDSLTEIRIAPELRKVWANPFASCSHLRRIDLSRPHPFLRFENGMLVDVEKQELIACTRDAWAERIVIPDSVQVIGEAAFASVPMAELTIPDSVTVIGSQAFADCGKLRELVLPQTVRQIRDNPVSGCVSLRTVRLSDQQQRFTLRGRNLVDEEEHRLIAFLSPPLSEADAAQEPAPAEEKVFNGVRMKKVDYPSSWSRTEIDESRIIDAYRVPEDIRIIGAFAFRGALIREIIVPDTILEIGQEAFAASAFLERCLLPRALTSVPKGLFHGCESLAETRLPDSVRTIGDYAFASSGIEALRLPPGVQAIGRYSFAWCSRLQTLELSEALTRIPRGAFVWTALEELRLPDGIMEIEPEALSRMDYLKTIALPAGLTCIPDFCFFDSSLTELNLPAGIEYIGDQAFRIDAYQSGSIVSLKIPEGVKYIGSRAFWNEGLLEEISLPDSLEHIGEAAFSQCLSLTTVRWPRNTSCVSDSLFLSSGLTSIDLPDSVSVIQEGAFSSTNLQSIGLPAGKVTFEGNPFLGCPDLREIRLPESHPNLLLKGNLLIDQAEKRVVCYVPLLEEAECVVPEGIVALGKSAFCGADFTKLGGTVVLPDSLDVIDDRAFQYADGLERIRIPDHVTAIGHFAFYSTDLQEVRLPEGLRLIGRGAFSSTNLSRLEIPDSVSWIGAYAFENYRLTEIAFGNQPVTLEGNPFNPDRPPVVQLPPDHPTLELSDGNLYSRDGRLIALLSDEPIREGTLEITPYAIDEKHPVIPASVRMIHFFRDRFYYHHIEYAWVVPGSPAEAFLETGMN